MAQVKLFEEDFQKLIQNDVQFLQFAAVSDVKETSPQKDEWMSSGSSKQTCSYCRTEFTDTAQQREHYKLDWHRYNLKQSLLLRQPVTEEEFNAKTDDLSSISGSDSEKEDNLDNITTAQGKVFLKNKDGLVFSLYRCLLFDKKEELEDTILLNRLEGCSSNSQWTLLMLGGGHFAGGVFKGSTPILHKTFHCYTVRAGQGSSQGSRDNRSGGSQPKSAGASLRRYNEAALIQHVRDIVEAWKEEISKSSLIIYRAVGPYNRSVLFGGKTPILNRLDARLRIIPFVTRRATFTELKRVHNLLTTIQVYDSIENALKQFPKQQEPSNLSTKRNKNKSSSINRGKSRESVERPLPVTVPTSSDSEDSTNNENIEEHELNNIVRKERELTINEQEIEFKETLETFGDSLSPEQRKQGRKKMNKKPTKSKNKRLREREALRKKEVYDTISSGDTKKIETILENLKLDEENMENNVEVEGESSKHQSGNIKPVDPINEILDEGGNTLLHVAAKFEQAEMVKFLLDHGADPCNKNDKQQTPYTCTQNKIVRDIFKDFAKEFPNKYNYNKAQIPTNLLSQEEQAEKKKLLKTMKREKEKEKRKQNAVKKQEDLEKDRFLNLSDREKRALAAERRILSQSGAVIARCFLCATDISGKVPFEYSGNRFCSIECLKAHRLQNPILNV